MPGAPTFSSQLLQGLAERSNYYASLRWATGLAGVDAFTDGLAAGDLQVLTGKRDLRRPLLGRIAGWVAGQGARVVYVSLLEREHTVTARALSTAARVPVTALTNPGSAGNLGWHAPLDRACEQINLTVLGSAADLRGEPARRAVQDGALDLLVIDDPSVDPVGVCDALRVQHILDGERGLPGALAYFASRRACAVLVGEPTLPVTLGPWRDVSAHVLSVHEQVEADVCPDQPSAVLTSDSPGGPALEVILSSSGLVRVDAPADLPPPALPQRPNVFAELAERAGTTNVQ